jgi:DNA polymerase-1
VPIKQKLYNGVVFPCDGPDFENTERLDLGALPIIHRMMTTGMMVDLTHFATVSKELQMELDRVTEDIHTMTGYYINPGSGPQKSDLLFKKLGLKQAKKKMTPSGSREAVDDDVLKSIQHEHPVVSLLQNFAEYQKLKGTYVDPMPKLARRVNFTEWRMFPNLKHTRVPSNRYACEAPNLLAMPNRTDWGRRVIEGFITKPGWVYLSVDESQIEPRVAAHRSGDKALSQVYHNNEDIYSDFAISAFKLPDGRFNHGIGPCPDKGECRNGWHYPGVHPKKHRFPSKTCTLASLYDVSAMGLTDQMPVICANCEKAADKHDCKKFTPLWIEDKCQDIINSFYMKYPGLMAMRRMDHGRARKHAYVWDDWGHILHCAAVRSSLQWVVNATLREIANFPIQSDAQGTMHISQAQVDDEFEAMGVYDPDVCEAQLQIHDELLFACREDVAQELGEHVVGVYENCVKLDVPIKAAIATAPVWGKMPK